MALQLDMTLESGIEVLNAYAKLSLAGDKDGLTIYVNYYVNKQASEEKKPNFSQTVHEFVPSEDEISVRWDKQGYEYLKTLPEFIGSFDV